MRDIVRDAMEEQLGPPLPLPLPQAPAPALAHALWQAACIITTLCITRNGAKIASSQ